MMVPPQSLRRKRQAASANDPRRRLRASAAGPRQGLCKLDRPAGDLPQFAACLPSGLQRLSLGRAVEGTFLRDIAFPGELQRREPAALAGIEPSPRHLQGKRQALPPGRLLAPGAGGFSPARIA